MTGLFPTEPAMVKVPLRDDNSTLGGTHQRGLRGKRSESEVATHKHGRRAKAIPYADACISVSTGDSPLMRLEQKQRLKGVLSI